MNYTYSRQWSQSLARDPRTDEFYSEDIGSRMEDGKLPLAELIPVFTADIP